MHVNVKHVNTYIYIYIPKFNFNLTVNMDLVVIFSATILSLLPYCQVYWQSFETLLTDKNLSL